MATYYARKTGNINATDVWATTPTGTAGDYFSSFTNADVLVANSFTVTVNVNTTVASVLNDTTGGATGGGTFAMSVNGVTLTANVTGGTTATFCVTVTAVVSLVGTITGGPGTAAGSGGGAVVISAGSITVTGSVSGGTASGSYGIQSSTSGSLSITGNVTAGSGAFGMHIYSGNSTTTITGSVLGGNAASTYGINFTIQGSLSVTGTATGAVGPAVFHSGTGTVTVTRAKGGPNASSGVGVTGSTTGSTSVEEIEYGDLGASPVSLAIRLKDKTSNVAVMYRAGTTKKVLTDPNATGLMPSAANVRYGTVYNGGNSTGTMQVPAAGSVALGVPVDNTTGTAVLTPANVWNYLISNISTSGSIGERLKNCSTIASVGQQLSDSLSG